ncbi:HNH endonuclease [Nocardioides sp. R1-1]|uniref:HNH endonuclease n=1 Tax=Nocardioides sp. R1-1 TaxID=3383502 RepID=UPI0038D141D1
MSLPKWGGYRAQRWKAEVLARYGTVCVLRYPGICTEVATTGDHIVPRSVDLSRQYDVSNGRPACLPCNQHRGDGRHDPPVSLDARAFFESAEPLPKESEQSPPQASRKTADGVGLVRFEWDGARS